MTYLILPQPIIIVLLLLRKQRRMRRGYQRQCIKLMKESAAISIRGSICKPILVWKRQNKGENVKGVVAERLSRSGFLFYHCNCY